MPTETAPDATGIEVRDGVIELYSSFKGRGKVRVDGLLMLFDVFSFDSGWPRRPPRIGEPVKVLFTSAGLLRVRSLASVQVRALLDLAERSEGA